MNKAKFHRINHQILFNECNGTGMVSASNCFKWFENARFIMAQDSGIMRLCAYDGDVIFPVTYSECYFYRRIIADTKIEIRTTLSLDAGMRMTFKHIVLNAVDDSILAEGKTQVVVFSITNGKVIKRMSEEVVKRIKEYTDDYKEITE